MTRHPPAPLRARGAEKLHRKLPPPCQASPNALAIALDSHRADTLPGKARPTASEGRLTLEWSYPALHRRLNAQIAQFVSARRKRRPLIRAIALLQSNLHTPSRVQTRSRDLVPPNRSKITTGLRCGSAFRASRTPTVARDKLLSLTSNELATVRAQLESSRVLPT